MRPSALRHGLATLALVATIAAASTATHAQTRVVGEDDQAYLEALRREDPTVADRYVVLRDARAAALADMRKVETQYHAAGPQLRGIFINALLQARKKYAETSLALLDFFDERDTVNVARYREEISKINALVEDRRRTRAELEKLLAP